MIKILDMQFIRYANLFNHITRIRTNHCFEYNNTIIFAVPRRFVTKAIGPDNRNLEKLSKVIGKRIKIVAIPDGIEDIENFVSVIIRPQRLRSIEVRENEVIISSDTQNKAALIGRGKVRLQELENILGQYFNTKKVRIK
jgi:transcription antitermination factor NusA-like protein